MKKILALFLITSIIGGSLHFDELAKVSFLKQHYYEHKAMHQVDGVFDFLYKHYVVCEHPLSEKDKKEDAKLPFKSVQSILSHFTPFTTENNILLQVRSNSNNLEPFVATIIHISFLYSIWQPPK